MKMKLKAWYIRTKEKISAYLIEKEVKIKLIKFKDWVVSNSKSFYFNKLIPTLKWIRLEFFKCSHWILGKLSQLLFWLGDKMDSLSGLCLLKIQPKEKQELIVVV